MVRGSWLLGRCGESTEFRETPEIESVGPDLPGLSAHVHHPMSRRASAAAVTSRFWVHMVSIRAVSVSVPDRAVCSRPSTTVKKNPRHSVSSAGEHVRRRGQTRIAAVRGSEAIRACRLTLVQALAPRPVRVFARTAIGQLSATLDKPLNRECLLYRGSTSLDVAGQWPVCVAGTSPTEIR